MAKAKVSGIYCITSTVNGKQYVGSSVDIGERWKSHLRLLKKGSHHSPHLQNHVNKYTVEDLMFNVIEEVVDVSLLINVEQYYIDTIKPKFNCAPNAGSVLGLKKKGFKYYRCEKDPERYVTHYRVRGKQLRFTAHLTEEDAIAEVEYIKSLTEDELLWYKEECVNRPLRKRGGKYYHFNKKLGKYEVSFRVNGKQTGFGSYVTEQEAITRVEYITSLTDSELVDYTNKLLASREPKYYYQEKLSGRWGVEFCINGQRMYFGSHETEQKAIEQVDFIKSLSIEGITNYYSQLVDSREPENYYFCNTYNRWFVKFRLVGKDKCFGRYKTEQEAIDRVKEVKLELGLL